MRSCSLIALFVGGVSGGLVTATLMRIPGEPNAIMTCLDGFPMAKAGRPGRALGLGNTSSIVGGALSWVALVLLTPPLARVAVIFGPWEIFAVVCMALVLICIAEPRIAPQGADRRAARHAGGDAGPRSFVRASIG